MNVTADPIVYQPYNINDSYIDYRLTTTSYGGLAVLLGGHADHTNSFRLHVLVQFPDLSSLPGNVQSATFELYRYGGGGTGAIISAYQITADWSESTVTPNNQPSVNPTVVGTFDAPDNQGVWHSFDITDLYNAWKAGTADNYGIELRTGNNNGEGYAYYSSEAAASYAEYRPRLVLTIPEPATVGVMALGALVVLRRRPGRHGA